MSTLDALARPASGPGSNVRPATRPAVAPIDDPDAFGRLLDRLRAQFAARAAEHDAQGSFPFENFQALHEHGLVALVVPRRHGGAGATLAQARRVIAAVGYAEPATALVLTMTYLQHRQLGRADSRWPEALRARVFESAVRDGALVNALRVEPALGTPARGGLPGTVARATPDGWRLNGHKRYCTGIPALAWLSVWGRTDEPEPRVGVFLVPRDAPGIRVVENWDHLGLRASASEDVIFEDVPLPLAHAVDIRAPEDWSAQAASHADIDANTDQQVWMMVLIGAIYDAVARAARDWLIGFLAERVPSGLGAPLSSLARVQEGVGEIEALLQINRALLDQATEASDAGRATGIVEGGIVKYAVTGNAVRVVEHALRLCGNHGLARANPLERHYRDVLCGRVHTPQDDSVLIAAGKAAFETARATAR